MTLLEVRDLHVRYGGVVAVSDLDLTVDAGQLVGLIGPNGAGKTSTVDALTGFTPARGSVELDGRALGQMPSHRRVRAGLARTWQSVELFDDLSVEENLLVASDVGSSTRLLRELLLPRSLGRVVEVDTYLELLDLAPLAAAMPTELSQGQRKLVGVARALMTKPKVLCLDEPAAGLDHRESKELGIKLKQIVQEGTALLLIDHDMDLVLEVCDHVYMMEFGVMAAEGTPAEIRTSERVAEAYLGRSADTEVTP